MKKEARDTQKQNALQCFVVARQQWEKSGARYTDYLTDRDAFYKTVRQEILPEFIKAGGNEEIFLEAMQEYAREDWIKSGYDEKEFDQRFKSAKRQASFKIYVGIIASVFILMLKGLIEKFFEVSIGRADTRGYAILFILSLAVITMVVISVQWIKNKVRGQNGDEISSLKLN